MSVTAQELQNLFAHPSIRNFNSFSQQVFSRLARCHTAASGMHTYSCDNTECKNVHYQYHSCGNRHCMFCGMFRREQWMEDEQQSLLPATYYHVVFTIPHELNALVMGNRIALSAAAVWIKITAGYRPNAATVNFCFLLVH